MLLLELTDGTQTVFGMEYQLIPFLKVTTPPGTKVTMMRISGSPIQKFPDIKNERFDCTFLFVDSSDWQHYL